MKIRSLTEFYDMFPENELIIVDVFRSIVIEGLMYPIFMVKRAFVSYDHLPFQEVGLKVACYLVFGTVLNCNIRIVTSSTAPANRYFTA